MSNRELPMMPWYPDQFLASTRSFSWREAALYRALLDAQWAANSLPCDERLLARIARMDVRTFRKLWPTVKSKFQHLPDGSLQNFRLEQHRLESEARRQRLAEAGRLGGQASLKPRGSTDAQALMLNPLSPSPSPEKNPTPTPSHERGKGRPLRSNGTNPRAREENSRALGTHPRAIRQLSLDAWESACGVIDYVRHDKSTPPLTWAYVQEHCDAPTWVAICTLSGDGDLNHGCRVIAERDRFTVSRIEASFREAYETAAEAAGAGKEDIATNLPTPGRAPT